MEIKNDVKGLKEESKIYEREILRLLLEISKSFSSDNMTKEKRDENFKKIDELREKLRDISKIVDNIEDMKYDCAYKDIKLKQDIEKVEDIENQQEISLINTEYMEKEETIQENRYNDDQNINNDYKESDDKFVPIDTEITKEDLYNIDKVIENMNIKKDDMISENTLSDDELEENRGIDQPNVELNNEIPMEDAIEKIDRLIKEAKELNNNVIKFPEEKVVRRTRIRGYEENKYDVYDIDNELDYIPAKANLNFDYKQDDYKYNDEEIEPVPVLFSKRRESNQLVVRKNTNTFSEKIKTLIYKIKLMIGGEDEE